MCKNREPLESKRMPCRDTSRVFESTRLRLLLAAAFVLISASGISTQELPPARQPPAGSSENPGQRSPGGMAAGSPHDAIFDSQHRPITAGGFVKNGPIVFQDVAAAA